MGLRSVAGTWYKSSRSGQNGECVEVKWQRAVEMHEDGLISVRDSKNPAGPTLRFMESAWESFVADVKAGSLNL